MNTAVLVPIDQIPAMPVEWLWPDMIPRGKLTLLAGDPGLGKSFISLDIAARTSRGGPFPGVTTAPETTPATPPATPPTPPTATTPPGVPASTILLSAEDDPADTVRPRLTAMGADLSRIRVLDCIRGPGGGISEYVIGEHTASLDRAMDQTPDIALLVVDPVSAYVGGVDSYNNAQVRAMLKPLSDLAAARRIAVVLVTHLRKSESSRLLHRTMGSLAFAAASRVVLAVTKSTQDPDLRYLLTVKSNLAGDRTAIEYSIDDGRVQWGRVLDAEGVLGGQHAPPPARAGQMDRFVAEVKRIIAEHGRIGTAQCYDIARAHGVGRNKAAGLAWKTAAGLVCRRTGDEWWIEPA